MHGGLVVKETEEVLETPPILRCVTLEPKRYEPNRRFGYISIRNNEKTKRHDTIPWS